MHFIRKFLVYPNWNFCIYSNCIQHILYYKNSWFYYCFFNVKLLLLLLIAYAFVIAFFIK